MIDDLRQAPACQRDLAVIVACYPHYATNRALIDTLGDLVGEFNAGDPRAAGRAVDGLVSALRFRAVTTAWASGPAPLDRTSAAGLTAKLLALAGVEDDERTAVVTLARALGIAIASGCGKPENALIWHEKMAAYSERVVRTLVSRGYPLDRQ